tara:strand:+ start:219 stop:683 length:465 start_codon:yes stop_codon:yes gene_type:complete
MNMIDVLKHNVFELQQQLNKAYKRIKELTELDKVYREWGYYVTYDKNDNDYLKSKIKKLVVYPGKKLSMQRHSGRSELWFCAEGIVDVNTILPLVNENWERRETLTPGMTCDIAAGDWHQLVNNTSQRAIIYEIQHGDVCDEGDIERTVQQKAD